MLKPKKKSGGRNRKLFIEDVVEPHPMRDRISLARSHPEVAAFWLYEKNCGFTPEDFSRGSKVRAWWYCPNGPDHVFQQSIWERVRQSTSRCDSCPFCASRVASVTNSLKTCFPKLAKEWLEERNKVSADRVVSGSHKPAWWRCRRGHEWKESPKARTKLAAQCPACAKRTHDLSKYPEVLRQFDKTRNKWLDPLSLRPHQKVWWKCNINKKHTWYARFDTISGVKCPECTKADPLKADRLIDNEKLRREFHPTKNGSVRPRDVALWSHQRVWWRCPRGPDHEWQTSVKDRASYKTGCPFCANKKLSVTNALANVAPHVASEWHPTKNLPATPHTVIATSMRKYWFCCPKGHEYQQKPFHRTNHYSGCRECYLTRGSRRKQGESS